MSTVASGAESIWLPSVTLEARLHDGVDPIATAYLLPGAGPTAAHFEASRRKWVAGDRVTPMGLAIGTLVLHGETHKALYDAVGQIGNFALLHDEWDDGQDAEELLGGYTDITRLIHVLARTAAIVDVSRRGLRNPMVSDWQTTGGTYTSLGRRKHVDSRRDSRAVFRYVVTSIGSPTLLDMDPISIDEVDASGSVQRTGRLIAGDSTVRTGRADITLFEGHTPHEPPEGEGPHLFTTVDII